MDCHNTKDFNIMDFLSQHPRVVVRNYTWPKLESPPFLIKGQFVLRLILKENGCPLGCVEMEFCAK